MLGSLGDLTNILKSAKEMQGQIAKMQEELAHRRYQGDAGGGMVRATVDGKCALIDIKIEPQAAKDVELLEDLITAAVCAAVTKAQEGMKGELAAMTGGLNIPGLTEMLVGS